MNQILALNILYFTLSCLVLIVSGSYLVKSLSKVASFLRVSEYLISFILMAFATSLPELAVGISSAIAKNSNLSLGIVIGSNIVDITLVIGIAIVFARGITIKPLSVKRDTIYMFFISILPVILFLIGNKLSRIDGTILLLVFILYSYKLIKGRKKYAKKLENNIERYDVILNTFIFIISIVILFLSSKYVVEYATAISIELFLPLIIVGLFLVAIGTSLPELVFELASVTKGHSEFALGNIIGSVVVNSTLVLGVTALIWPIEANFLFFLISAVFMILVNLIFLTFVYSSNKLDWREGVSLIFLYVFFLILIFYVKLGL